MTFHFINEMKNQNEKLGKMRSNEIVMFTFSRRIRKKTKHNNKIMLNPAIVHTRDISKSNQCSQIV